MNFLNVIKSVAEKVGAYAFVPIVEHVSYLIFYEGNFKKLEDHVKELEVARERIYHSVEEERRNGKEIETDAQNWLKKVNEVIVDANKLQEDPGRENVGCSEWLFPNLFLRHQLSLKATKMTKDVVEVHGKAKFDRVGYLPPLDGVGSSSGTSGCEKLETRESIKEGIMKALRDPKVCNIGVYGLGGMGKTHLVKEVSQIAKLDKLFDAIVMSNVSKAPDLKTIQGEIADLLGLRFDEETIAGRAYRLRRRIKAERSILVVLDDIWMRLDLEKVGIPSRGEHNACKLLMTSRNKDVLLEMNAEKDFRVEVLSEAEAWSLFEFMAGDVIKDITLHNVATQVAKKCAGFPIRLVTVAAGLKNKDIYDWKDALRQLESVDDAEMEAITYSALEIGYKLLKSDEMQALFLLFGVMYGEKMEYFLKVAMGLDIFKHMSTVEDARNRLYKIIGSLKSSCLLLEGNTREQIQMHDLVREVAISIASRDQYVFVMQSKIELKEWPTKNFLERCTQIILDRCHIHDLPERLDCPNVKFFYLSSANLSLETPDTILEGMRSLKVLDLTCLNMSSLPTSFRSLTKLHTLCLDQCILEKMDEIAALKNLKILRLCKSSMIKLPSEIGKLTQLRILDLSHSGIEFFPPNIISSLTKLEELSMGNTSIKWEVENPTKQNENASLAELRELSNLTALELQIREAWILPRDLTFEKLERYKIVIGDVWEWFDIEDVTLKTLKLKLRSNIHLEHGIKALIKRAENLYLDEVDGISNVLYQLNGEGFPLLKYLHIQNNAKMMHIVDSMGRNQVQVLFLNLETLILHNLKILEKICNGPLAVNSFSKLRVIKVKNCIQLEYLLSFSMIKGLSQLLEIEVCQCNSMNKIVYRDCDASAEKDTIEFLSLRSLTLQHLQTLDNFLSYELMSSITEHQLSETSVPVPFFSSQVGFPNLDTLKLSSLNLNKIWDDGQPSVSKLTNLIVENCGGLKYLFSSTMVGSFINLKRLEISKCHSMDWIIATEERNNGTASLNEVRFSKLETIILKDMENMKTIWHCQFDTVKALQVKNCKKIVVVFPSSIQETYHNLETLEVTECALVEDIFELTLNEKSSIEDGTQLKSITLEALPKLKRTWSRDPEGILHFHNLENVFLRSCESLDYLFPFSVATHCSLLKELSIKECGNMKEIVAEKEGSMCTTPIFEFNELNTLLLWNLYKLKGFYAGNYILACSSLRKIDVFRCAELNLYKTLSTSTDGRFLDGKHPDTLRQSLFRVEEMIPNLEWLRISYMDAIKILQAKKFGALFTKLTFLGLTDCKYEDASFPDWFLQNVCTLEHLVVEWSCYKKIFLDERLLSKKPYPRLKKLTLSQLPKLQHLCEEGSQIDPVLQILEFLFVKECPSLTNLLPSSVTFSHLMYLEIMNCNGLISLITSPTARSLVKLAILKVKECNSLEEIMIGKGEEYDIAFISLEILMLESLPSLNKFCSNKCFLRFPLLEQVVVKECPRLKIFSMGNTSTPNLRKVKVAENEEEWNWNGNLNDTIKKMFVDKVAFCCFMNLKLSEYLELKELWCGQLHCNAFNNLKYLVVQKCDFLSDVLFHANLLQVFMNLEELDISVLLNAELLTLNNKDFDILLQCQYSGDQFRKLKSIWVSQFTDEEAPFPYWFLENVPNLEELGVQWSSFREIFQDEQLNGEERQIKIRTMPRELTLHKLHKLKHICKEGFQIDPILQCLESIHVSECSSLINLVPSSVAFNYLTNLEITNCIGLINLISCSTTKSLVNLETMKIKWCDLLEDVVSGKEDETNNEIAFFKLQTLELICLPRLCRFSSCKYIIKFSLLEEVVVKECPQMEVFSLGDTSTPNLQGVQIEENNEESSWEGDLNETIKKMFEDKVAFCSFKHLKLSEYPELKELWYGQLQCNVFSKLRHLVVHKCDFLSKVLFQLNLLEVLKNLEELDVRECDSLEAVFDVKGKSETDVRVTNSIQLKKLKLSTLPKLKHVWKEEDPHGTLTFQNLCEISVTKCKILTSLFPLSIAREMINLQDLEVRACGVEEIVAKEGGTEEIINFEFPHLTSLDLSHLPNLKAFFNGIHSLQCKSLKAIKVFNCKKLELFKTQPMSYEERAGDDKLHVSSNQPFFTIEQLYYISVYTAALTELTSEILELMAEDIQQGAIKKNVICRYTRIDGKSRDIVYEGIDLICNEYRKYGHRDAACPLKKPAPVKAATDHGPVRVAENSFAVLKKVVEELDLSDEGGGGGLIPFFRLLFCA
ncbi:uncharacterized protein LOC133299367 [Gastrolobium bilobum]|uniref:uncharacterized protein LOC133299367 n=1 Tax=Gastrolobium bilobum TaxID=150636 RepID=UPI002AB31205|nr:uncharacterized protein LOC133299367 [Gastrolobium bilobum]